MEKLPKIRINLAKSSGFCFGVKRALDIALNLAKKEKNVEMLGDIVHNETVVKQIELAGINKIKRLSTGKCKTLLIRAHGTCKETIKAAKKLNYNIIDATCPMVKEIHKKVQDMENQGFKIIITGDKKHDEVRGIAGQLKTKAIVIGSPTDILIKDIKKIKKACVVSQSTQNIENVLKIVSNLRGHIKHLRFFNTICSPTRIRQEEIKIMPKENDLMIIIGSKSSANTKRLYEISKSINANTYWVQSRQDLKNCWFKDVKSVGISSGASTPDSTTKEIINFIKGLSPD